MKSTPWLLLIASLQLPACKASNNPLGQTKKQSPGSETPADDTTTSTLPPPDLEACKAEEGETFELQSKPRPPAKRPAHRASPFKHKHFALAEGEAFEEMVPMTDGTKLWTKVSLPEGAEGPVPVVIERTIYFGYVTAFDDVAAAFNSAGYAYVLQTSRGIHLSEGTSTPFHDDVADGGALVAWVMAQDWAKQDGIGTYGCSYNGFTAIATAMGSPHVKVVLADGPVSGDEVFFNGGVANIDELSWLYRVDKGDWAPDNLMASGTNSLRFLDLDEMIMGRVSPYWRQIAADPRPGVPFWKEHGIDYSWKDFCTPVMLVSVGEMTVPPVWTGLFEQSCNGAPNKPHRFIFMPTDHCTPTTKYLDFDTSEEIQSIAKFFDERLIGTRTNSDDIPPVQYRVTESGALQSSETFPPPGKQRSLYLRNTDGALTACPSEAGSPESEVMNLTPETDDPCANTTPQLVYTSAPAKEAFAIVGQPVLTASLSADVVDLDLFAYIFVDDAEVAFGGARARYRNGYDTAQPVTAGETATLTVRMQSSTIIPVPVGSRLRIYLRSTACKYNKNALTGEPAAAQTHYATGTLKLRSDSEHPSVLVFDTIPMP